MCITWKVDFVKCAHQKETGVHSYCYKYRHTRVCNVEEVKLIEKTGRCAECKAGGEGGSAEEKKVTELEKGGSIQWNKTYEEVGQGRLEGFGI